jgi:hypothetical protein
MHRNNNEVGHRGMSILTLRNKQALFETERKRLVYGSPSRSPQLVMMWYCEVNALLPWNGSEFLIYSLLRICSFLAIVSLLLCTVGDSLLYVDLLKEILKSCSPHQILYTLDWLHSAHDCRLERSHFSCESPPRGGCRFGC